MHCRHAHTCSSTIVIVLLLGSNYFYVRPRSGAPAATTCVEQGDERKAAEKARKAQVRSGKLVQGHGDSGLEVDYFVHDHAVSEIF